MEVYKIPIEFAIITFPFIAFILTIPFLIYQYRKYGAIPILKSIIFYSFILYLITAFFMVILPLPSMEYVSNLKTAYTQLKPFQFIKDIMVTIPSKITNLEDFLKIFNISTIYVVIFNFLLTLPFGVYLRYYFNKKWYQTILYSLALSLFFELTQLSGLYGIYPRPYRLFDIDDLIINTSGGLFGHIITPIFMIFLPTQKELEDKSYKKGKKVSLIRRALSVLIDAIFVSLINVLVMILGFNSRILYYSGLISILTYYILVPLIGNGRTIGKKILQMKLESDTNKYTVFKSIIRNLIVALFIIYPNTIPELLDTLKVNNIIISIIKGLILIFIVVNIVCYIFSNKNNKRFLYEKITGTRNCSTIEYETTEEKNEKNIENINNVDKV